MGEDLLITIDVANGHRREVQLIQIGDVDVGDDRIRLVRHPLAVHLDEATVTTQEHGGQHLFALLRIISK